MKVLRILCIGAVAIWLTPASLADKYDDLAAKGYRWVTVNGPYGYFSRDDLRQFAEQRGNEFELIKQLRAVCPRLCERVRFAAIGADLMTSRDDFL